MEVRGMAERRTGTTYDKDQIRATIDGLGIDVAAETYSDFLCYCPFHSNTVSPSFTVGVENGLYICHNASCKASEGGNLVKLVLLLSDRSDMEALRYIKKKGSETQRPLAEKIAAMQAEERWPMLPQLKVDELVEQFWNHAPAIEYMTETRGYSKQTERHVGGFDESTLREYEVGYDPDKDMVVVPIHDKDGNPIGVNGRSIEGKRFKLSKRLPRNKVLFNMHRAKRAGGTVIMCESQFDVLRVYQAGFPNAVCVMGSHVSKEQAHLLQRYFDRLVIMTDADKAGRKMGHTLSAMVPGMRVEWAIHDWGVIYPHGAKDAGDMTIEEIRYVLNNSVSDVAYKSYKNLA